MSNANPKNSAYHPHAASIGRAAWLCVWVNAILAIGKLSAGWWGNSLAVLGDGLDTAFDVIMSLAAVWAASLLAKPPDIDHPYGHARAEAVNDQGHGFYYCTGGLPNCDKRGPLATQQ